MASLRYVTHLEEDKQTYIFENYDTKRLEQYLKDIKEAIETLQQLEIDLYNQYNKAILATEYREVTANREQAQWGNDKHVYILIGLRKYRLIDNKEVFSQHDYHKTKKFRYQEINSAVTYIKELLKANPGSRYRNNTTYTKLSTIQGGSKL